MHLSAEVEREAGTFLVLGKWEAGRIGAGKQGTSWEMSPYKSIGLRSGGRAVEVKKRWVQPGSLQTQALGTSALQGRAGIWGLGLCQGFPSHSHLFSGGCSSSQVSMLGTVSCSHSLSLYLVHLGPCRCTRSSRNLAEAHSVHPAPEFEGFQGRSWAPKGPSPEEREVGGTGQGGGSRTVLRGLGLGCAAVWGGQRLG